MTITKPMSWWHVPFMVLIVGILAFAILKPIQVLPRIALAPGFALLNQQNRPLTSEDLRGRIVLYNFTYSRCTEPCPQTSHTMRAIQQRLNTLDTAGLSVELVTVSFDPDWDSPTRLQRFAHELHAETSNWHFVSGNPVQLKQIIGGTFNTYYQQNDDGTFVFDPAFILVDGWGIQRAEYRHAQPALEIIERDINLLIQEAQNQEGITRYAYEAAHLFLCYP